MKPKLKSWAIWFAVYAGIAFMTDPGAAALITVAIWIIWTFFYQIFYLPKQT